LTEAVELSHYDLYAGDGHFHGAAAHDPRDAESGTKSATGHCFTLNLRTLALQVFEGTQFLALLASLYASL
jgi:hypothetical protein